MTDSRELLEAQYANRQPRPGEPVVPARQEECNCEPDFDYESWRYVHEDGCKGEEE